MDTTSTPGNSRIVALVVDDQRSIRAVLGAFLEAEGVGKVLQAENGAAALHAIEASSPPINLMFCDLEMPGIDGVETLRSLTNRHRDLGIVVMSGLHSKLITSVSEMAQMLGLHLVGTLPKPITREAVQHLLGEFHNTNYVRSLSTHFPVSDSELESALCNDQLEVYYQPKIRLADSAFVGVEALVRLNHPAQGVLSPSSFVPIAEQSDQIVALTMSVVSKAVAQVGEWSRQGVDLDVAINMSPRSLRRLTIPESLAAAADAAGVAHDRITVEITESHLVDTAEILDIVSRLRLKGFKLAIDDFGTGHSSLQQLHRLPFNELKIDQSFVRGAATNAELQTILASSIDLGTKLGMAIVAEGVESWLDWRLLRSLNCTMAQGYIAARPMTAAAIPIWADRWHEHPCHRPPRVAFSQRASISIKEDIPHVGLTH